MDVAVIWSLQRDGGRGRCGDNGMNGGEEARLAGRCDPLWSQ